jgi:hypothetical protein
MNDESCCTVSLIKPLDQDYWDAQYKGIHGIRLVSTIKVIPIL